jgi:cytochrome c2
MKKSIYSILIFSGIILIAKTSLNAINFPSFKNSFDNTTRQIENDSLLFSQQNIENQLVIIGNLKTAENITKGEALYTSNCGRCHKLFKPEKRNINAWMNVMKRMAPQASLTEENYKLVCVYLNSKTTSKEIIKDSTEKEEFIFTPQQW